MIIIITRNTFCGTRVSVPLSLYDQYTVQLRGLADDTTANSFNYQYYDLCAFHSC